MVRVLVPVGTVTVLLGSEPERRRLVAMLTDTCGAAPDGGARRFRRVIASPASPVAKRIALLEAAVPEDGGDVDLVVVDRATDGVDAADRRRFLHRLGVVAARGAAVVIDDVDPVAALAVAGLTLRICRRHGPRLEDVACRAIPDVTAS